MIIAFGHKAQMGKDTAAGLTTEWLHEHEYEIKKFATKLKEFASSVVGVDPRWWEDNDFKNTEVYPQWKTMTCQTWRDFLREVGQKMKSINEDFWVNALISGHTPDSKWVISDLRFPNEAAAVRRLGGVLVNITRPGVPTSNHESETALDGYPYDYYIVNDGSREQLAIKLYDLCKKINLI